MDSRLEVIGNQNDVLCYNLNKQFCNIKKLIITSDVLLKSFDSKEIFEIFVNLSSADETTYSEILKSAIENGVFDKKISPDAGKDILEKLQKLFNEMNVELSNYNFMSSISNTKFNVTLRCEHFSITKYYQEKNTIPAIFTQLLVEYLSFEANELRNSKISKFQIEITISEDIFKHVYLKKEGNKLLLASAFGFKKGLIHDYGMGAEFYISEDEEFHFYKNSQNYAILRDHTKLKEQEIHEHEKILSNEELILLNKNTKNIDDVLIEMYINPKGSLRITNVTILENPVKIYSSEGFVIYKSTNNYNKISLLTLRDDIDEETPNPKYLIIKNKGEIQELFEDLSVVRKIDGLIFTTNFYTPVLEMFGEKLNIDIIFVPQHLQRSLETTINWENFSIEGKKEVKEANPFNTLMKEETQQKDEMLERLQNVDLSTPAEYNQQRQQEYNQVSNTAQGIISSPESTTKRQENKMDWGQPNQKKKSAMAFLADAALNGPKKEEEPQVQPQQTQNDYNQQQNSNNQYAQTTPQQQQTNNDFFSQENIQPQQTNNNQYSQQEQQPQTNNDFFSQPMNNNYNQEQPQNNYNQQQNQQTQPQDDFFSQPMNNNYNQEQPQQQTTQLNQDSSKYDNVLATKIITPAHIPSENVFADMNTMQNLTSGNINLLVSNVNEMNNNSINYIIPISQKDNLNGKKATLLLNSPTEYFMLPKEEKLDIMINLDSVHDLIKENYLESLFEKENLKVSIMTSKENLNFLTNYINKIESVYVQNLQNPQELQEIQNNVLAMEKKWLMKNN